jgi:hypothetical protein
MAELSGEKPVMWGSAIVGFGNYHYKYTSGREGDAPAVSFSPRKDNFVIYFTHAYDEYDSLLAKLGKYSTSKWCLYIKRLSDIDIDVLKAMIKNSLAYMKKTYG